VTSGNQANSVSGRAKGAAAGPSADTFSHHPNLTDDDVLTERAVIRRRIRGRGGRFYVPIKWKESP
jgi:hypothetical protein